MLATDPQNVDALNLSGALAAQRGDSALGVERLTQAGLLCPTNPDILYNLGQALRQLGRIDEAAEAYRHVLILDPQHRAAGLNLATILVEQAQPAAALSLLEDQIARHPADIRLLVTKGQALAQLDRGAEAESTYRTVIARDPQILSARINLVDLLADLDRLEEAEALALETLRAAPDHPILHNNYGRVLVLAGRNAEAAMQFRHALTCDPDYANAHMNLGMSLLAQGDFRTGWPEYEWRWRSALAGMGSRIGRRWTQDAPRSNPVLLFGEQGFGDILQFCRFAPYLARQGLRVQLAVPMPLVRLLAYSFAPAGVSVFADGDDPFDPGRLIPGSDCPLMSIPAALGLSSLDAIPNAPYFAVPPDLAVRAAARIAATARPGTRLNVGLVWSGNPRVEKPSTRMLSARRSASLPLMAPLAAVPGITLHALQIGAGSEILDDPPFRIVDHRDFIGDFLDTAALIQALDLVISVDTSVAHLAGGLGRPTWMLSRYDACWRWLEGRSDTPWYPSLRIWRQTRRGDWSGPIEDSARALADLPLMDRLNAALAALRVT